MLTGALIALLLGAVSGLVMALTGAGGGIVSVPLLVTVLALDVASAAPIALLAVGCSAAVGAVMGLRAGTVRYRAALLIAGSGLLLTPLGVLLAQQVENTLLMTAFAGVLLWVGARALRRARDPAPEAEPVNADLPCLRSASTGRFVWTARCARSLASAGALAGLLAGLLGVGGGFVIVPALQRYTDLDLRGTVATSLAVIALLATVAVATSSATGTVDWPIGLPFATGAVLAMVAGRRLAARLPASLLHRTFAALAAMAAVALLVQALSPTR